MHELLVKSNENDVLNNQLDFIQHEINTKKSGYWQVRELVVIGVFAAIIKISTLLIALAGGGMNPVSLILKNAVATVLLVVLLYKVPKFGVMTLFGTISLLISFLITGDKLMILPGTLTACVLSDLLLRLFNGYRKPVFLFLGVAFYDLLSRVISLGVSYLIYREAAVMFWIMAAIVGVGYLGCLLGIGAGIIFVKELKHAGIIRN